AQWELFERKREAVARELERLKSTWVSPRLIAAEESQRVLGKAIEREYSLADLLRRPNVRYDELMSLRTEQGQSMAADEAPEPAEKEQSEIQLKYACYIQRQAKEIQRHEHYEHLTLPPAFDYLGVTALSLEVRQKLDQQRPETLGQASRIAGVTPAAISL